MSITNLDGFSTRELWATRQIEYPIPEDPNHKVVTCHYAGQYRTYVRGVISEPWQHDEKLLLVDEQVEKVEGDLIYFYRKYANIPGEGLPGGVYYKCTSYAYRFPGYALVAGPGPFREPFTQSVMARIEHKYYHTSDPFGENGIPIVQAQRYLTAGGLDTEYLWDAIIDPTTPSRADYLAYIALGALVASESSVVEQYMGNIYLRRTTYIKAF